MNKVNAKEEREIQEGGIRAIIIDSRITKTNGRDFNHVTRKFYASTQKLDFFTMTHKDGHFLNNFEKEEIPHDPPCLHPKPLLFEPMSGVWSLVEGPMNVLFELICIHTQSKGVQFKVMPTVRSLA